MGVFTLFLCALVPLLLVPFLIYVFGYNELIALAGACGLASILAFFIWDIPTSSLFIFYIKGLTTFFQIALQLILSVFLISLLSEVGFFSCMANWLRGLNPDERVQGIIAAWFFGTLLQGICGYGTVVMGTAILLVALDFPALCALAVALICQLPGAPFALAGAPLIQGMESLWHHPAFLKYISEINVDAPTYIRAVSAYTALLNGVIGIFIPWIVAAMMRPYSPSPYSSWLSWLKFGPFALFCGIALVIPHVCTAIFLGPEFANLIGGAVGLFLILPCAKYGVFIPNESWDFFEESKRPPWWHGTKKPHDVDDSFSNWRLAAPLIFLGVALFLTRLPHLPIKDFLLSLGIHIKNIKHSGLSISFTPFFDFNFWLLLTIGLACLLYRLDINSIRAIGEETLIHTHDIPSLSFAFMLACIFGSTANDQHLISLNASLGKGFAGMGDFLWPFFVPFLGAGFTFFWETDVTSNILLSTAPWHTATSLGFPTTITLALQAGGASVGMFITHHVIHTATEPIGLISREIEGQIKMIAPTVLYVLALGILAWIGVNQFGLSDATFLHP